VEHLEREALANRVRELEARLAAATAAAPDLDFIAEQALKVLENSGIAALIYDTEGGLRILAANACVSAATGFGAAELAGMNLPQLLGGDDPHQLERLLRLPRQGGYASGGRWRTRSRNGEVRHVEVGGYDLSYRGRRARFVIVQDVTRRRQDQLAQQRLASIVERSQDAILSQTLEGIVLSWNPAAERLFGWAAAEIIGRHHGILLPEEVRAQETDLIQSSLEAGHPIEQHETVRLHRDGTRLEVVSSLVPLRDTGGTVIGASSVLRDLRPARREQSLRESEQQLQGILEHAAEGIVVVGTSGSIERSNAEARRMFGYAPRDSTPLMLRDLLLEFAFAPGAEDSARSLRALLGGRREVTGRRLDGTLFPLELSLSEIAGPAGPPQFTAVVRDITERKAWESRIYQLAYSDSLTGLPNRLLLRDRLEHAMAAADRNRSLVGVLFFDLDHFKAINDSYGHHTGDQILRRIAERTRGCVREIDTVCRLGGDEFVLVLPELREAADAAAVARKLLSTLSEPYPVDDRALTITPTVGISIYPRDGTDAETLVRNADAAMYHAKESGKNRYWFYRPAAGP
jgi:diguanylate cyclase (GGDEF)-like protein/PAS domain S-box-containing protein